MHPIKYHVFDHQNLTMENSGYLENTFREEKISDFLIKHLSGNDDDYADEIMPKFQCLP